MTALFVARRCSSAAGKERDHTSPVPQHPEVFPPLQRPSVSQPASQSAAPNIPHPPPPTTAKVKTKLSALRRRRWAIPRVPAGAALWPSSVRSRNNRRPTSPPAPHLLYCDCQSQGQLVGRGLCLSVIPPLIFFFPFLSLPPVPFFPPSVSVDGSSERPGWAGQDCREGECSRDIFIFQCAFFWLTVFFFFI